MKLNDKCHLIISGHKPAEVMWEKTGQTKIWESKKQKLILGVIISFLFLIGDSLHARLNNYYEAWSYKKKKKKKHKRSQHTQSGNLFRKNLQLKDVCQF